MLHPPATLRTLYIAGPMSFHKDFNYPAFNRAAERLRQAGYTVINPADNELSEGSARDWYAWMRISVQQVAQADGIATLPGWADSRGARLEVELGNRLAIPYRTVDSWIKAATPATPEIDELLGAHK